MAVKRRKVIFAILVAILVAVGGFAASLLLIPSQDHVQQLVALDEMREAEANQEESPMAEEVTGLEQHKQAYVTELDAGTLSYDTVQLYSQSLLADGQNGEALKIWQAYVAANPQDVAGWKEYTRIGTEMGNEDVRLQGLQKIAELETTEENLLLLSYYQNDRQDYIGQVETLKKMVAVTNENNPQYMLDLADIALLVENEEVALAALNSYYTKHATRLTEEAAASATPETVLEDQAVEPGENGETPASAVAQPAGADYTRLPNYIRLLALAERDTEALAQALEHTKDGRGVQVRTYVAEMLLFEVGPDAAVEYVETISAQNEVPENLRAVYARALVQQGKYETALPSLKALSTKGGDYREWYFLALSSAAKEDKETRRELTLHVKESFASGELTEEQKMDRVYALLNAGEKARALDYTERSIHSAENAEDKAKWLDIYKGLTVADRQKKVSAVRRARVVPQVSLEQKFALARQPGAKEDYIRNTAFELLNANRKDEAVELFSVLAAKNGPSSSDTGQMLYLWGARIAGPELGWVIDRANSSTSMEEQSGWVSIVAAHAASEDIIAIAQQYPDWLRYTEYERRYVDALLASDDTNALNQYISSQASSSQTVDMYYIIASRAQSVADMRTAEEALQKAAQADPANRETWLRMTDMYASRARYSAAEQTALNALNTSSGGYVTSQQQAAAQDVAANYYAASFAKRRGELESAQHHFSKVVSIGQSMPLDDISSRIRIYSANMELGNEQFASQGFENMLAEDPGNANILADYMSALLDRGNYLQALDVASRHGNDVSVDDVSALEDTSPLLVHSINGEVPLLQSMSSGRELKLIFDRPIPEHYNIFANDQNPSWVSYTTTSYDTALVVAQSGYELQAAQTPNGLMVSAVPVADTTSAEVIRQRYLRLQLLYARLELETDAVDRALERLESLAPIYQEYPEYRAYQGNAEYYAGNPIRGLNLVKRAQKGDPYNEDIRIIRRDIERFDGQEHLLVDQEYQRLGDSDMHITTLEARKQFYNSIEVIANYQTNFFDTDLIQRPNGNVISVNGHRWRGELSLAKFMDDSSVATGTLYANRDTAGAGLAYQFVNMLGTTGVYADWHKPYWDLLESVVEDGTRDRLAAWHLWRPNPDWSVRVDGGVNRYHIDDKTNIADAIGVQAFVLRGLYDEPYIGLAYGFDGQYITSGVKHRDGKASNKLLPLRSQEIHSLIGIVSYDVSDDTSVEASAGYAVDRLGEHGPSAEGRVTHYIAEEVDVQLRARYGLEAGNADNDALSVGGYVRWTW